MTKKELFALVRELELSQRKSEILTSHLRSLDFVLPDIPVHVFRHRQAPFMQYFTNNTENNFVYCNDINGLLNEMTIEYNAEEWRLFIDSSKTSLKAVLLFVDNTKPSIPVAYGIGIKGTYESMQLILNSVKYNEHGWRICADLKVVALLTGLKGGWPTHACFLCTWYTRFKGNQYEKRDWELRDSRVVNEQSIIHNALVPTDKILLPPLHIKLGVMKNFVKSLPLESPAFQYLQAIFPNISYAKIREGTYSKSTRTVQNRNELI